MTNPALERHNAAVRRTQDQFGLYALLLALALPADRVADALATRAGWPAWPTLGAVALLAFGVGYRPVTRWTQRRVRDPQRSTRRYLRAFLGSWVAGLVLVGVLMRTAAPRLDAGALTATRLAAALATAWLPFVGVMLLERVRPAWLSHAPAAARSVAPAA